SYRNHPADRNCEKERNHDGGFCPGSTTRGRQEPRRSDIPGLALAVPPDFDDDDGGVVRRYTARLRWRNRSRTPPSSRHSDHRRPAGEPAVDPVHNACNLPGLRPSGCALPPPEDGMRAFLASASRGPEDQQSVAPAEAGGYGNIAATAAETAYPGPG